MRRLAVMLTTALIMATAPIAAPSAHAADLCTILDDPIYQTVNPATGSNLLTPWLNESVKSQTTYGFTQDEGAAYRASISNEEGLVEVHHYSRYGDFVDASSTEDRDALSAAGYSDGGKRYFASATALDCTVPVHLLTKGSRHRQSAKTATITALKDAGWTDSGVSFHAIPVTENADPGDVEADAADLDGRFSIAAIPDTQNEVLSGTDRSLDNRNKYLVDHRGPADLDLRAALHVGDLANWDTDDHIQYEYASRGMKVLDDAKLPWVSALGNHDTYVTGVGGSARPGIVGQTAVRETTTYNTYFPPSRYPLLAGAWQDGKQDNSFHTFDAGGRQWLVLVIELWPRKEAVAWAKSVVESHPHHNVIVLTHDYLTGSGSISTSNGGYGATSPSYIWEQVIKPYPNVKLVLSGHEGFSAARTDTPADGTKVLSLLRNYKDSDDYVRTITIDITKGTITHKYFATNNGTVASASTTVSGFTFVS